MTVTPANQEQKRRAERRANIERWNAPVFERRIDVAERAAFAAFPIDRLGPTLRVIENVVPYTTAPRSHIQACVAPWTALCIAGNRRLAALLWRQLCPGKDFDDDLWRVIEATQPVTADRGAVERVVALFAAIARTRAITRPMETEFTAWWARLAEKNRLRMGERIAAARAGIGGLRLFPIDEHWSAIYDREGMRLIWERLGHPPGTFEAAEAAHLTPVAKARTGARASSVPANPVMELDESERARILAEEGGIIAEDEADIRAYAVYGFRGIAESAAVRRPGRDVMWSENFERKHFELRPKVEQEETLRDAVHALHRLLTKDRLRPVLPKRFSQWGKRFQHRGLSVRPRDLRSGLHVSDILYFLGQPARLWRLIVREGVTIGAFWFEEREDVAVMLANPNWWPGDPFNPGEPAAKREIDACLAAMGEPYPETLPGASWLKNDCGTGVRT
jgi:hypothetical protein